MELYGRSTAGRLKDRRRVSGRRFGEEEQGAGQDRGLKIPFGSERVVFREHVTNCRPGKGFAGPGRSIVVYISQWRWSRFVFPAITGCDNAGSGKGGGEGALEIRLYPAIMKQHPGEKE